MNLETTLPIQRPHRDVQLRVDPPLALQWHEVLQGICVAPLHTLSKLRDAYGDPSLIENPLLRQQTLMTLGVILLQVFCNIVFKNNALTSPFSLVMQGLTHVMFWLVLGGGIAYAHYVFTQENRYGLVLTLTGASALPWVLLPVVSLLKESTPLLGYTVYAVLWAWTSFLFLKSVALSFNWSSEQLCIAISLPFVGSLWVAFMYTNVIFSLLH
jgi:hypothetical protein